MKCIGILYFYILEQLQSAKGLYYALKDKNTLNAL